MSIETFLFISHLDSYLETALQVDVEVYQVRIDIVQDGTLWSQTQWGCESATERFNVAS